MAYAPREELITVSQAVAGRAVSTGQLPLNLRDRVARSIRVSITSGELAAGQVYSVPALAARFDTSATPVREAMLGLARERLVEPVPNKGFRVLVVTPDELAHINEIRLLLEPPAIAGLAGQLSGLEVQRLRTHIYLVVAHAKRGDIAGAAAAALAFRDSLLRLCPNDQLVEMILTLRARARAGYSEGPIDYSRFAETQHRLLNDLTAGNADRVARTVAYGVARRGPVSRRVASGS